PIETRMHRGLLARGLAARPAELRREPDAARRSAVGRRLAGCRRCAPAASRGYTGRASKTKEPPMPALRLGLTAGYSGASMQISRELVLEAERLGFWSVWSAEAYGSDAVSPLAYIAAFTSRIKLGTAIMQMPARTPAMTAMTAMTLDALSGGRFILGLGPSGPQVVEGWHGVAYGKPLTRTREYIQIVRKILAREAPVEFKGEHYEIPYRGPGASGLGKPLKSILHGRKDLE